MPFKSWIVLLLVVMVSSCASKYTVETSPVQHTFEKKDGPKAMLEIVPLMFANEGEDDGVFFFRMASSDTEEIYLKDFFKNFESQYELKKLLPDKGGAVLVYDNKACKEGMEDCVDSIYVKYGPPNGYIDSCRLDRTHNETGEKSVVYKSRRFPFFIKYQLRGSDKYQPFATVLSIKMTNFEKFQTIIQHIKSIYTKYDVRCE